MLSLPADITEACAPLFAAIPLDQAMPHLVGSHPQPAAVLDILQETLRHPAISQRPALASALWLYVDDLDRSHTISQSIEDTTGSYWHGIMHRREGDFSNGHYWMRRAARHPLLQAHPELDPDGLIDKVVAAKGKDLPDLLARQREEWKTLFEWCANHS